MKLYKDSEAFLFKEKRLCFAVEEMGREPDYADLIVDIFDPSAPVENEQELKNPKNRREPKNRYFRKLIEFWGFDIFPEADQKEIRKTYSKEGLDGLKKLIESKSLKIVTDLSNEDEIDPLSSENEIKPLNSVTEISRNMMDYWMAFCGINKTRRDLIPNWISGWVSACAITSANIQKMLTESVFQSSEIVKEAMERGNPFEIIDIEKWHKILAETAIKISGQALALSGSTSKIMSQCFAVMALEIREKTGQNIMPKDIISMFEQSNILRGKLIDLLEGISKNLEDPYLNAAIKSLKLVAFEEEPREFKIEHAKEQTGEKLWGNSHCDFMIYRPIENIPEKDKITVPSKEDPEKPQEVKGTILVMIPMSGHNSNLLRKTIYDLVCAGFNVVETRWKNPRITGNTDKFSRSEYIDTIIMGILSILKDSSSDTEFSGKGLSVLPVCHGGTYAPASMARLAELSKDSDKIEEFARLAGFDDDQIEALKGKIPEEGIFVNSILSEGVPSDPRETKETAGLANKAENHQLMELVDMMRGVDIEETKRNIAMLLQTRLFSTEAANINKIPDKKDIPKEIRGLSGYSQVFNFILLNPHYHVDCFITYQNNLARMEKLERRIEKLEESGDNGEKSKVAELQAEIKVLKKSIDKHEEFYFYYQNIFSMMEDIHADSIIDPFYSYDVAENNLTHHGEAVDYNEIPSNTLMASVVGIFDNISDPESTRSFMKRYFNGRLPDDVRVRFLNYCKDMLEKEYKKLKPREGHLSALPPISKDEPITFDKIQTLKQLKDLIVYLASHREGLELPSGHYGIFSGSLFRKLVVPFLIMLHQEAESRREYKKSYDLAA